MTPVNVDTKHVGSCESAEEWARVSAVGARIGPAVNEGGFILVPVVGADMSVGDNTPGGRGLLA